MACRCVTLHAVAWRSEDDGSLVTWDFHSPQRICSRMFSNLDCNGANEFDLGHASGGRGRGGGGRKRG